MADCLRMPPLSNRRGTISILTSYFLLLSSISISTLIHCKSITFRNTIFSFLEKKVKKYKLMSFNMLYRNKQIFCVGDTRFRRGLRYPI